MDWELLLSIDGIFFCDHGCPPFLFSRWKLSVVIYFPLMEIGFPFEFMPVQLKLLMQLHMPFHIFLYIAFDLMLMHMY